jgi:hypothetical protein
MAPSEGERLDLGEAIERLQAALRLQYRSALACAASTRRRS